MFVYQTLLLFLFLLVAPWSLYVGVHGAEEPIHLNATSDGPQHCFKKILFMYNFTTRSKELLKKDLQNMGGGGQLAETQAKVKAIANDLTVYSRLAKQYNQAQANLVNRETREVGRLAFEMLYNNPELRQAESRFKHTLGTRLDYYAGGHTTEAKLLEDTLWRAGQSGVKHYLNEAIKYVSDCATSLKARNWFPESVTESIGEKDEELDLEVMNGLDQLLTKLSYGQDLLNKAEAGEDIGFGPDIDPVIAAQVLRQETLKVESVEIPSFVTQHKVQLSQLLLVTTTRIEKLEPLMMKMAAEYELVGDEIEKWDSMLEKQSWTLKVEYDKYDRAREEAKLVYAKYYKISEQNGAAEGNLDRPSQREEL